eukprot:7935402-Ditylum_brightwellii.AAC.2
MSVQLMAQLHHALKSVQNFENNEMFYFSKSIAIMYNSKDGQLGDTRCQKYLQEEYNLFQDADTTNKAEESDIILCALSYMLKKLQCTVKIQRADMYNRKK